MKAEWLDPQNSEQAYAYKLLNETTDNLFLTGKAGTGKSTFLRHFSADTAKVHIVLAPTGLSAINVGGQTIHSFFKLPLRPILPEDKDLRERIHSFTAAQKRLIKSLDLIIIDEVSMVRADIMDAIDLILRKIRGVSYAPFGGVQMLFVGDLYQLEPVIKQEDKEVLKEFYSGFFFFDARVFKDRPLIPVELTKVYRQTDRDFIALLDRVRIGAVTDKDLVALNQQVKSTPESELSSSQSDHINVILTTRNDRARAINTQFLEQLPGEERQFEGTITGDFPEKLLPTEQILSLKPGAQVIFIVNDPTMERRWVNGSLGVVEHLSEDEVRITLEDGEIVALEPYIWQNVRYTFDSSQYRVKEEVLGQYMHFPIRLAWAITVHKSQGLTFDNVHIDLSGGTFAAGQTYVALSRCRTLEGITLQKNVIKYDLKVNPQVVAFYKKTNNIAQIEGALHKAKAMENLARAAKYFRSNHYAQALSSFLAAIEEAPEVLQEERVRRLLYLQTAGRMNLLKEEVARQGKTIRAQESKMQKLSAEYVALGKSCLEYETETQAALNNFTKAVDLDAANPVALAYQAYCRLRLEDLPRCKEALKALVQANPDLPILEVWQQGGEPQTHPAVKQWKRRSKVNKELYELLTEIAQSVPPTDWL